MQGKVIEGYQATAAEPLVLVAGEEVQIDRDRSSELPGWVWSTSAQGQQGWVPESFLEIMGGESGLLSQDYRSQELTIQVGDVLTVEYEESGWLWATNAAGQSGWVPKQCVQI